MWQVLIDFLGGPQDQKRAILDLDRAKITFANLLKFKVKMGYSARDFMYYMKRCGNDTALLQRIDYEEDALAMIEDCIQEKKIRIAVLDTQLDQEGEYAITPIKQRSTHEEVSGQGIQDEDIDAYKMMKPLKKMEVVTIAQHQCSFQLMLIGQRSLRKESAFSKVAERIELEASVISKEQERHILHETYKETTRCRSRKESFAPTTKALTCRNSHSSLNSQPMLLAGKESAIWAYIMHLLMGLFVVPTPSQGPNKCKRL
ncbi:unnamed protein product [Miscanthus lutarioriparius]|uniref:Uncharacterized protein n=1 Tax=Miscanthus lutarioriparius TaxID=422564 RepID=A0A811QTL9_9POAL|nr:unnamed protein product [Miscanthus lutarioriparius]